ncbi:YqiA/YcfP family alpha/beta fold hydrolase [Thalassotalea ponticola]|uniref:YqiA/YcfP family alpha/beta fold hydrolase n=1 Tax=Thalassotalea ponticola TaxID=1523392 RepID=UPI0025B5CB19|nr:YqiA/YcfP family alpha/beta fold hydrolase [Thalassotalea ponticola]MDN3653397.1 YqiA/YcfP family alpha/beta fold hydrolase [Thalassotalea ponticola]
MINVLIIHGFNSSPKSLKAQLTKRYIEQNFCDIRVYAPQLANEPEQAIQQLREIIDSEPKATWWVTGSSLGGYFATYLSETYDLPAVLINPAVRPFELLEQVIGRQTNPYTGQSYQVTKEHMQQLAALYQPLVRPENYLVLVQTGDEVLDYRQAVEKYQNCQMIVQQGGDHSFIDFEKMLPDVVKFFQLANNEANSSV